MKKRFILALCSFLLCCLMLVGFLPLGQVALAVGEDGTEGAAAPAQQAEATAPETQAEPGEDAPPTRAAGDYVLNGVTHQGHGYVYVPEAGYYYPRFGDYNLNYVWEGDAASNIRFSGAVGFYLDASHTQRATTMPNVEKDYYFRLDYQNTIAGDHSIDFSKIDPAKVNVTIDGFTVEYLRAETNVYNGYDDVRLYFKATKLVDTPAAQYVLNGVTHHSPGYNYSSEYGYYFPRFGDLNLSYVWEGDAASNIEFGGSNGFYPDASHTQLAREEPEAGKDYYFRLKYQNTIEDDHSIDFSKIDPNKVNVTIQGFTVEFLRAETDVLAGHDQILLFFKATKLADTPAAQYVLKGLTATATGYEYVDFGGAYWPDYISESFAATWAGVAPFPLSYTTPFSCFYTDEGETQTLTTEPVAGESYYLRVGVDNKTENDHSMDFSQIDISQVDIKIMGFTVQYLRTELRVEDGHDQVRLHFKATKNADYVLKGLTANGSGYEYNDNTGIYWPDYGSTRAAVWADAAPPSTAYYIFHSRFHTNVDETQALTTEPVVGESYYMHIGVANYTKNDHSMDFSQVVASQVDVKIAGFTVQYLRAETLVINDHDEVVLFFKATKNADYILNGVTHHGTGYHPFGALYVPDYTGNQSFAWAGDAADNCEFFNSSSFFLDASLNQGLMDEPEAGNDYYFRLVYQNTIADDHSIDFSQIDADKVNVTLEGFTVEYLRAQTRVFQTHDQVLLYFKATKNVAADYVLKGVTHHGTGYAYESNTGYYRPQYSDNQSFVWEGDAASNLDFDFVSRFFLDAALSQTATVEPEVGTDYYFRLDYQNTINDDHSIDFTKIDPDKVNVTLEGFTVEFLRAEQHVFGNNDELRLFFKATKLGDPTPGDTFTVTFDANGHGTAPTAQTVTSGQTATRPADPTEEGWVFGGWFTEAECTNAFDFATPVTGNITLFAKWTQGTVPGPDTYTVTFDANGHGTAPAAQTVQSGQTATKPVNPVAAGWRFGGWYKEAACINLFDFTTPITGNITLYAKWTSSGGINPPTPTPLYYVVTFDANGHGVAPYAQMVESGKTAARPTDPSERGWRFDGWYTEAACINPFSFSSPIYSSLTLYAKWTWVGGTYGGFSPKTGDLANPYLWLAVAVVCAGGIAGLIIYNKRKNKVK